MVATLASALFASWLLVRASPWLIAPDIIAAATLLVVAAVLESGADVFDLEIPGWLQRVVIAFLSAAGAGSFLVRGLRAGIRIPGPSERRAARIGAIGGHVRVRDRPADPEGVAPARHPPHDLAVDPHRLGSERDRARVAEHDRAQPARDPLGFHLAKRISADERRGLVLHDAILLPQHRAHLCAELLLLGVGEIQIVIRVLRL